MSNRGFLEDAATRHQIYVERFAGGSLKALAVFLLRALTMAKSRVADGLSAYGTARYDKQISALHQDLLGVYAEMGEEALGQLRDFGVYEATYNATLLGKAVKAVVQLNTPSPQIVSAAAITEPMRLETGKRHAKLNIAGALDQYGVKKSAEIVGEIRMGSALGEASNQIAARLNSMGVLQRSQAEALTRTMTNHIATSARVKTLQENSDILEGMRVIATLDNRTTILCVPAETEVVPAGNISRIYRRWYEGEFVTIATAAGNKITLTPNHPVLTARGWLPANEVKPGDKVINAVSHKLGNLMVEHDVGVKAPIGALFDSLFEPSGLHVEKRCASQADFHGDGMGGDEYVDVAALDGDLGNGCDTNIGQSINDVLLCGIAMGGLLPADKGANELFLADRSGLKPSKLNTGSFEAGVEPGLGSGPGYSSENVCRACTGLEKLNGDLFVSLGERVSTSSWALSSSGVLVEEGCDGSYGCAVHPSDAGAAFSVKIASDDVLSVSVELRACHVYNLECDLGYYIADGIIIHNCASLDQKVIGLDEPASPFHWGCRSTMVPVLKAEYARDIPGSTRPSKGADGVEPVNSKTSYPEWLARQPASFQKDVLGRTRYELFSKGKLDIDKFVDNGRTLTLDQLREREPASFERAGLD